MGSKTSKKCPQNSEFLTVFQPTHFDSGSEAGPSGVWVIFGLFFNDDQIDGQTTGQIDGKIDGQL